MPAVARARREVVAAGASLGRLRVWVFWIALAAAALVLAAAPAQAAWKSYKYPQYGFGVDFPGEPRMGQGQYRGVIAFVTCKLLGARRGKFNADGTPNPIPGHNIPFAVLGTLILRLFTRWITSRICLKFPPCAAGHSKVRSGPPPNCC